MSERAHVTSTEAIEAFRSYLIAYLSKTKPVLEDVFDEVARLRDWLERDRRGYWEQQVKRRAKMLSDAQQALFSARLCNLRSPTSAEQAAVTKARHALAAAEAKLRIVKKWARELDLRVQPFLGEVDQVRTLLARDMPAATVYLAQVIRQLDAYAGVAVGPAARQSDAAVANVEATSVEVSPEERK
jgi:hypothetical protein